MCLECRIAYSVVYMSEARSGKTPRDSLKTLKEFQPKSREHTTRKSGHPAARAEHTLQSGSKLTKGEATSLLPAHHPRRVYSKFAFHLARFQASESRLWLLVGGFRQWFRCTPQAIGQDLSQCSLSYSSSVKTLRLWLLGSNSTSHIVFLIGPPAAVPPPYYTLNLKDLQIYSQ